MFGFKLHRCLILLSLLGLTSTFDVALSQDTHSANATSEHNLLTNRTSPSNRTSGVPYRSELNTTVNFLQYLNERLTPDYELLNETTPTGQHEQLGNDAGSTNNTMSASASEWFEGTGGRVSGATYNRPSAVLRGSYVQVCWATSGGSTTCARTQDFDNWTYYYGYIRSTLPCCYGVPCWNPLVGTVAMASARVPAKGGTGDKYNNPDTGLYMYGRTATNNLMIIQWYNDDDPYDKGVCPDDFVDATTMTYDTPSAIYINRYPYYNSFVLVTTLNADGYIEYILDNAGPQGRLKWHTPSKLVRTSDNDPLHMAATTSLSWDGGAEVAMFFVAHDQQSPPRVYRVKYKIEEDSWSRADEITSPDQPFKSVPWPFVPRIAPNADLAGKTIMMWMKNDEAIVTSQAQAPDGLMATSWSQWQEWSSDKPGSSCSEMVTIPLTKWWEVWTICFYRGARENGIWWSGYKFEWPGPIVIINP